MSEFWDAADDCDDGIPFSWRITVRLMIGYVVLAMASFAESQFRTRGIDIEARVEVVGETPKGDLRVRYYYQDPVTKAPRMNTVCVPDHLVPAGQTAIIEYLPGPYPSSRLKSQSNPSARSWFFWVNVVGLIALVGTVAYIAWEGHRPIAKSSERRCPLPRDPRRSRRR